MKNLIVIIARIAIIVLVLGKTGLFTLIGGISFTRELSFERERFLSDSLRKIAEPVLQNAENLASQNKYTVYQYFDDMTKLKLIEQRAGFNFYSGLGRTIDHLLRLSYENGMYASSEDLQKAKDTFMPRIDPDYGRPVPEVVFRDVLDDLLSWLLKWYLAFLPFALLWYLTQLYATPKRLKYLYAHPCRAVGMLLIYPYTLFWGVLRKASDGYEYIAVATELNRRGVKAKHKDVLNVWAEYKKSNSSSLQVFFEQRGFVVKRSLFASLVLLSLNVTLLGKVYSQNSCLSGKTIESARDGTEIEERFSFCVFDVEVGDCFILASPVMAPLLVLVTALKVFLDILIDLLEGFPPGIGHVPLEKVKIQFYNFLLNFQTHEKVYLNNDSNILREYDLRTK